MNTGLQRDSSGPGARLGARIAAVFCRALAASWLLASLLALPGCGGGGDGPPEQTKPALVQLSGTATDGTTIFTGVTVEGTLGQPRTSFPVAATSDYRVSLVDLSAPYMVKASTEFSVATGQFTTNATPLTTLLVANLFGQEPAAAFTAFGATNPALTGLVTEANIARAQAATLDFLTRSVGVPVPAAVGDFITTPFKPVAGDPMFELILALKARAAVLGPDAYDALVSGFIDHAHLCMIEKISITIGGTTSDFCPSTKSATPEDADSSVLDYVFTSDTRDVLTVRVRGSSVLDARYAPATGGSYSCSGAGCGTITLGAPAPDLTRRLAFAATSMIGAAGTAVLGGSLVGAIPGVVLPVLPCSSDRFFLIEPSRSVVADCVDIDQGSNFFGLPGTLAAEQGTTGVAVYRFFNQNGSNGLPGAADGFPTSVYVTLDGSTVLGVTALRQVFDDSTQTLRYDIDYTCRGSACQGVTVSPPTLNTDQGYTVEVRTIRLDNTPMAAVNAADGSLSTTAIATMKGSFSGLYVSNADLGAFTPPPADSCAGQPQTVTLAPADEGFVYPVCSADQSVTGELPNGDLQFVLSPYSNPVTVTTDGTGAVKSVLVATAGFESFGCAADCRGVAVSAPDASGRRTITLAGTLLHIVEPDGFATGARTATANGSFVSLRAELTASAGRPLAATGAAGARR